MIKFKHSKYDLNRLVFALSKASKEVKRIKILNPVTSESAQEVIEKPEMHHSKLLIPPKVMSVGLEREKGWLYYIDKDGDIARSKMKRHKKGVAKKKKSTTKKITEVKKLKERVVKLEKKTIKKENNQEIIKKLIDHIAKLEKRHGMIARDKNKDAHAILEKKIKDLKKKLNKLKK